MDVSLCGHARTTTYHRALVPYTDVWSFQNIYYCVSQITGSSEQYSTVQHCNMCELAWVYASSPCHVPWNDGFSVNKNNDTDEYSTVLYCIYSSTS